MKPEETRHIAEAMKDRRSQWRLRVSVAAFATLVFFPLTGWSFTLFYILGYTLIQVLELGYQPGGRLATRLGPQRYAIGCMALVFVNNLLIGMFGVAEAMSESQVGLACAALLLAGAMVNGVMVSPGSRKMMLCSILPLAVYVLALPIILLMKGEALDSAFQLGVSCVLMVMAGLAAWGHLSKSFRAMEDAQEVAEVANRAKSDFLATISHEIRTPLNGVLGMAQAMAADQLSGRQRERLDVVTQSGQALLIILNDVLDLAKIEARKVELEVADFDLETLVERSQETFHAIAESKGLAFEMRIDPDAMGTWRGDTTRLRQVLSNLISNAVKFTDEGSVTLTATTVDGGLRFVVEDTGPGVTPDQLPRLFKKFVQADASTTRRYGGTGLGLSICGELARLMGGSMMADHVEPHGLRFIFQVPVERIDAERRATSVKITAAPLDPAGDGRTLRVLAAEDHPVNRQVLTLLLSQAGIIPHIVENGAEAVEAWREGAPDGPWDLILMDVQMPVMDGPTAARTIRAEERAKGRTPVPIIALTANVMTHQVEDYRQAGMDTFVAKPIQVEVLLAGIETALAGASPVPAAESRAA